MPGKHTPRCKGAAKTIHGGKQAALDPVDIYWCATHSACHLVEHETATDYATAHDIFTITLYLQMCI